MGDKPILKRLDEYIQFAEARKCFSDLGFYSDVKQEIAALKQQLAERDKAILLISRSYSDWPMQVGDNDEALISKVILEAEKA